jgi:hypothetical protein
MKCGAHCLLRPRTAPLLLAVPPAHLPPVTLLMKDETCARPPEPQLKLQAAPPLGFGVFPNSPAVALSTQTTQLAALPNCAALGPARPSVRTSPLTTSRSSVSVLMRKMNTPVTMRPTCVTSRPRARREESRNQSEQPRRCVRQSLPARGDTGAAGPSHQLQQLVDDGNAVHNVNGGADSHLRHNHAQEDAHHSGLLGVGGRLPLGLWETQRPESQRIGQKALGWPHGAGISELGQR